MMPTCDRWEHQAQTSLIYFSYTIFTNVLRQGTNPAPRSAVIWRNAYKYAEGSSPRGGTAMFAPTGVKLLATSLLLGVSAGPVLEAAAAPVPSLVFSVDLGGRTFVNKVRYTFVSFQEE